MEDVGDEEKDEEDEEDREEWGGGEVLFEARKG